MGRRLSCLGLVLLAVVLGACGSATRPGQPVVGPRESASESSRSKQVGLSARIILPSTTIKAGASMSAYVLVENFTGHPLRTTGCLTLFTVALGNDRISPRVSWLSCAQPFTIPSDSSRYPVTVSARYLSCPPPPCTNGRPQPLPPGAYRAMLFRDTPLPITAEPIDVRVAP